MKTVKKILKENPDLAGRWKDSDAISFGFIDGIAYIGYNPNLATKFRKNNPNLQNAFNEFGNDSNKMMHRTIADFYYLLYGDEGIEDFSSLDRFNFEYPGRIWIDKKIISFWIYPSKEKLLPLLNKLANEINHIYGITINITDFFIELDMRPNSKTTYDNEDELLKLARKDPDFRYTDVTIVKVKDYEGGFERSPEELRSRHTDIYADRSDLRKGIKHMTLPNGMTQAEYNSKIKTSESKENIKTIILDEDKLSLLKKIEECNSKPYSQKVNVDKVRQGIMMYEDGYSHLIDEALNDIIKENGNSTITLYHGLKEAGMEYILTEKELTPRVCSEGGPCAIYFSEYPLDYNSMISIDVPLDEIGYDKRFRPYANTQYITLSPIKLNEYNFKIHKINNISLDDKELIDQWRKWWNENNIKMINAIQSHFGDAAWYDIIVPLLNGENNIYENINNEVDSSEISLASFKPQNELNSKIWINGNLNSNVRMRLLDIADDFIDSLNVDWAKPLDIIMTGSLTNFNWSKYSDIDLHVIYNFEDVDENVEFVKEYFDGKKKIWNDEHENLKIYGFPVEVYVQDSKEKHTASGIYSLEKNEWIVKPDKENIEPIKLDKFFIKQKAAEIMTLIDKFDEKYNVDLTDYDTEQLGKKIKFLFTKIKSMRKASLSNGGEMSDGNVIFKILRRTGYIDKLIELKSKTYDLLKSLR